MIPETRQAGRELDAIVAERVMGWGWVGRNGGKWFAPLHTIGTTGGADCEYLGVIREAMDSDRAESPWWLDTKERFADLHLVPEYSTRIEAAWLVVEKMRDLAYMLNLHVAGMTNARFVHLSDDVGDALGEHAESSALAICLAALASLPVSGETRE